MVKKIKFDLRMSEDERAMLTYYANSLRMTPSSALRMAIRVLAMSPAIRAEVAMRDLLDRQASAPQEAPHDNHD